MKTFKSLLLALVLVFGVADVAQAQWKIGAQGGIAFANEQQRSKADLDFVLSAGPAGLVMVEGEASEI